MAASLAARRPDALSGHAVRLAVPAAAGAVVGVIASARQGLVPHLDFVSSVPLAATVVVVATLAALPLFLRHPFLGLSIFVLWLPFEDLVRKFAGNDVRVYVVKELLFVAGLIGIVRILRRERAWQRATGEARFPLIVLMGWAIVLSVLSAARNPLVPLAGLRLDFFYAPLAGVGFLIASSPDRLRRAFRWLMVLGAMVLIVGVIQAVVGPTFLAPRVATPGLGHLIEQRTVPGTLDTVFRPTGTFVDPSRFSSWALFFVALGIATLGLQRTRRHRFVARSLLVVAVVALVISGGRAALIGGSVIGVVVLVRRRFGPRAMALVIALVGFAVVAVMAAAAFFPRTVTSHTSYYARTLNPKSNASEWSTRYHNYTRDAVRGIRLGGVIGNGTGTQSLGLQYILGGETRTYTGLYAVESGYGAVGYEWGFIGFALWIWWTVTWFRRLHRCARVTRGSPYQLTARALMTWIFFFLFLAFAAGYNYFQDYGPNAFFWLASGAVFGLPVAVEAARDSRPVETLA